MYIICRMAIGLWRTDRERWESTSSIPIATIIYFFDLKCN